MRVKYWFIQLYKLGVAVDVRCMWKRRRKGELRLHDNTTYRNIREEEKQYRPHRVVILFTHAHTSTIPFLHRAKTHRVTSRLLIVN